MTTDKKLTAKARLSISDDEWVGYLRTLENDGVPTDHIEKLRREGREAFVRKIRAAMRRGSGKLTQSSDSSTALVAG